ncbi:MAG TPA: LysR family transcriptional regulator [Clostridiales bacterium]|nr:LysR family transcriptional regulator [Clostridiales bacterium]
MNHQDLSLYRIFHIVANHGNISKAAKELYVSQPAISKSISKLEKLLDVKLFKRTSRGVLLSNEGEVLYKHTKKAFEVLYIGEKQVTHMNQLGIGSLKIGVSTTLCKYILLPYLNEFVHDNPHISITISCQSTYKTLELLEENEIDIGLVGEPHSLRNLDFYKVHKIQDIFVATKTYLDHLKIREGFTNKQKVNIKDIFRTCNLMLLDKKNISREHVDDYINENKIETNQILEVTSLDLLIDFAKTSLGVACVIKEFIKEELEKELLIEIPLSIPINTRSIGFVYKTNSLQNSAAEKFIEYYKNKTF